MGECGAVEGEPVSLQAVVALCASLLLFGVLFLIAYVSYQISAIDDERDI